MIPSGVLVRDVMENSSDLRVTHSRSTRATMNVLWVGRLNANKDPLTVLEGFARFAERHRDATLTFVYGSAELESPLRDALRTHRHVGQRVRLAGPLSHAALGALYADADVFVLGSHREGSGYAALEAMACGVVPVLTNIPPFRGLTDEGRIG